MSAETYSTRSLGGATGAAVVRRISWGAVIAGAVIAITVQLVLNLLGMGIGLATFDVDGAGAFGVGAAIWWLLSGIVSVFLGGWVASRLAGLPSAFDGMIHGVLVWSAATLITFMLLTSAVGRLVGGAASALSSGMQGAAQVVQQVAPEAGQMLNQANVLPQTSIQEVTREIQAAFTGANAAQARQELQRIFQEAREGDVASPAFRQRVVEFLTSRAGLEQARAQQLTDQAIAQYQQAQQQLVQLGQQAERTGEDVAHAMGAAALWSFFALLLGAIAAAFGGRKGAPRDVIAVESTTGATVRTHP